MSSTPETSNEASGHETPPLDLAIPPELIQDIPEEQRDLLIQYVKQSLHVEHFSGPLPPPNLLSQYEPDVQRLIVNEAVENRLHRTVLESRGQIMYFAREILGLLFGFVLALVLIVGSVQSVLAARSVEGLIGIGGAVSLVVGAFLYTDHKQRSDRKERQALREPSTTDKLPDSDADIDERESKTSEGIHA